MTDEARGAQKGLRTFVALEHQTRYGQLADHPEPDESADCGNAEQESREDTEARRTRCDKHDYDDRYEDDRRITDNRHDRDP